MTVNWAREVPDAGFLDDVMVCPSMNYEFIERVERVWIRIVLYRSYGSGLRRDEDPTPEAGDLEMQIRMTRIGGVEESPRD
jgi:hypothetical protein